MLLNNGDPIRRRRSVAVAAAETVSSLNNHSLALADSNDEGGVDAIICPDANREQRLLMEEHQGQQQSRRGRRKRRSSTIRRTQQDRTTSDSEWPTEGDDLPFFILVFRVGLIIAAVSFICFTVYQYVVPSTPGPFFNLTDGEADFDDDDDAIQRLQQKGGNNAPIETEIQQQQSQIYRRVDNAKEEVIIRPMTLGLGSFQKKTAALEPVKVEEEENQRKIPMSSPTLPPMPVFNLSDASNYDAYAMLQRYRPIAKVDVENNSTPPLSSSTRFWQAISGIWQQFSDVYGGDDAARAILDLGLTTSSRKMQSIEDTACRIRNAQARNPSTQNDRFKFPLFRMVFGGYSVTAGRGNYFSQSFPFVMERQLDTIFLFLNLTLSVANHAIGGVPSFPYGWCMDNFFGNNADTISWDFSMNEAGGDPFGLAAYLRHASSTSRRRSSMHPPKVFIKDDTHLDLALARQRLISDGVFGHEHVVIRAETASHPFVSSIKEEHRPTGFREWRKFGSPIGAPGQSLHHPAVAEHVLIAWLHTMHMLPSIMLVQAQIDGSYPLTCPTNPKDRVLSHPSSWSSIRNFDAAIYDPSNESSKPWSSLFLGEPLHHNHKEDHSSSRQWQNQHMNPIFCRTSFEPVFHGNLSEVVATGITAENVDALLPKSNMFYNKGWVLDVGDSEKQAIRKLQVFGGLGFIDRKKAYYGIYTSGTLSFLLPFEHHINDGASAVSNKPPSANALATDWYKSITVCSVNEKRDDPLSCVLSKDVDVTVGGVLANHSSIATRATLYLGRKMCIYIPIPDAAILTTRADVVNHTSVLKAGDATTTKHVLVPNDGKDMHHHQRDNEIGLSVQVRVRNRRIMKAETACSISHIVWEQRTRA